MFDTRIDTSTKDKEILLVVKLAQSLKVDLSIFNVTVLEQKNLITKEMLGRGKVYFFTLPTSSLDESNTVQYALRHYRRGGFIAKISSDKFIYTGLESTRCYQELSILVYLKRNNINVPTPIAARVKRAGMFYSADIITEVITDTSELHELLQVAPVQESTWRDLGKQIRLMHNLNVCHYDINVKNILVQQEKDKGEGNRKVFLIDFDKCARKKEGTWKVHNLERLHRSLQKQQNLRNTEQTPYHFTQSNWQALLNGYSQ